MYKIAQFENNNVIVSLIHTKVLALRQQKVR